MSFLGSISQPIFPVFPLFSPRGLLGLVFCFAASAAGLELEVLTSLEPAEFAKLPAVHTAIDPDDFDRDLLAAAIFHETNRWRAKLGLKPFRHKTELDRAADMQCAYGSLNLNMGHTNPVSGQKTPAERVRSAGVGPGAVAESITLTPLVLAGEDPASGRAARVDTYETFAARMLAQLMNSPNDRRSITSTTLRFHGCSARPVRSVGGAVSLYAVQVFYRRGNPRD